MGYTHYWGGARKITAKTLTDVKRIIKASGVPITGWDGEDAKPTLTTDLININGVGPDSHENFGVSHDGAGEIDWGFCKTARKPYDAVVGAVLLRIKDDSPEFEISSDGTWDEWTPARLLYKEVTGKTPECPW